MKSLNDYDQKLVALVTADMGDGESEQDVLDYLARSYEGCFDSLADWAEWYLNKTGDIEELPGHLGDYVNNWGDFNFEKYASDEEENERIYSIEINGKIHVFRQ